jgi:hypothetical protein
MEESIKLISRYGFRVCLRCKKRFECIFYHKGPEQSTNFDGSPYGDPFYRVSLVSPTILIDQPKDRDVVIKDYECIKDMSNRTDYKINLRVNKLFSHKIKRGRVIV